MILRKLAKAFAAQNWFTVVLEVLIVVVGIFVGLQVDDWNEARKERGENARFLARLTSDMTQMRDLLEFRAKKTQQVRDSALIALRVLENCSFQGFDQAQTLLAFESYQSVHSPRIFRSAYEEMQSVGALARLKNDHLKDQLSRVYEQMEFFDKQVGFMHLDLSAAGQILWSRVEFSFGENEDYAANVNLLEHCEDRLMRSAVWELVDTNRDWVLISGISLQLIEGALSELEKERPQ